VTPIARSRKPTSSSVSPQRWRMSSKGTAIAIWCRRISVQSGNVSGVVQDELRIAEAAVSKLVSISLAESQFDPKTSSSRVFELDMTRTCIQHKK